MMIKQISVFIENKAGRLAEVTGVLASEGIDIRALSIADTSDFGILRIIVNNTDKAASALRDKGFALSVNDVLAVELVDAPGSLYRLLTLLSAASVEVEYAYAFIARKENGAFVILRVENPLGAEAVLRGNGINVLSAEQVNVMFDDGEL